MPISSAARRAPSSASAGTAASGPRQEAPEPNHPAQVEPRDRPNHRLLLATILVGVVVAVIAAAAAILLSIVDHTSPWTPVLQDVLKTSFQAFAVGALGGLAKLYVDSRRSRELEEHERQKAQEAAETERQKSAAIAAAELRDRRHACIRALVDASHRLANARLRLRANRSVKTWTEVIEQDIIPARIHLRQLTHDLRNWSESTNPLFPIEEQIHEALELMYNYMGDLIDGYADHKLDLSEMQLLVGAVVGPDRKRLLTEIWDAIKELPYFGDFVADNADEANTSQDHARYARYRARYVYSLSLMRSALAAQPS